MKCAPTRRDADALCARLPHGDAGAADAAKKWAPPGTTGVALSVPEIQHLFAQLIFHQQPPDPHHVIAHSRWRRAHQAAARRAHYRALPRPPHMTWNCSTSPPPPP